MAVAINGGLLTKVTAIKMLAAIAGRLGVDFDAEQELKDAEAEAAKQAEADAFTGAPTRTQILPPIRMPTGG